MSQQPSPSGNSVLPDDAQFLGEDTYYVKVFLTDGTWAGIHEFHKKAVGDSWEWCVGYVAFDIPGRRPPVWSVESYDPLTLSPSIMCSCGHHGYIRQSQWVSC